MTKQMYFSLIKRTNDKVTRYLDTMSKHHYTSGKYINASVRMEQYNDYSVSLFKHAQAELGQTEYMDLCNMIRKHYSASY